MKDLPDPGEILGFDWDDGNINKNLVKHGVSDFESEQVFFNQPLIVEYDRKHSELEERYFALGRTDFDRGLFVVFTLRVGMIRVISARDMNRKERAVYMSYKYEGLL